MNEKLNHPDLSALFAKETGMSGTKAENFTKALFDIIIEGLEQDGIVKINGLGTFKITEVADRYSVNVNTGEKFEIKGHKKISFVPADTLKDSVNHPFAMFEPVEVDENYSDDVENKEDNNAATEEDTVTVQSAEESGEAAMPVDINAIEEELPCEVAPEEPVTTAAEIAIEEEQSVRECESMAEQLHAEEEQQAPAVEETDDSPVTVEENTTVVAEETVKDDSENTKTPVPVKNRKGILRYAIYIIIGFICGFVAIKMLERNHTSDDIDSDIAINGVPEQNVAAATEKGPVVVVEVSADSARIPEPKNPIENVAELTGAGEENAYTFVMIDELAAKSDRSITAADTTLYTIAGNMAIHVVVENERLAKIAYDYYGSRKLWPYIARHNNLQEPYALAVGMELEIPVLQPK
ncbi:MAG: HU family DNA-binding protein [Bacteroidaceae bacterium]|nr:HU family DNA-binding protein [Bacteroidaceae bacterium]